MPGINRRAFLARGSLLTAGAALGAGALLPSVAWATPGAFAPIDAALRRGVKTGAVTGVAAMAATPDGVVYDGAFGKADVQAGTPMRDDTVFGLLSMTKAFTATAAMQLIEQGRMRLDQPAADILPQLAAPQVLEGFDAAGKPRRRPAKRPITVRHLLTHTSGFTYSIWSENLLRYEKVTG